MEGVDVLIQGGAMVLIGEDAVWTARVGVVGKELLNMGGGCSGGAWHRGSGK